MYEVYSSQNHVLIMTVFLLLLPEASFIFGPGVSHANN